MTDEGEEGWSIGLGYGASEVAAAERDTQRSSDVLLQRYMQQCLAYHHEQQQQQQQKCETTTRKSAVVERVEEEETTGQRLTFEGRLTEHQEAMIDNARAIAQRLSTTTTSTTTSTSPNNNDYAMKRAKHAERHNQRLRRALVSNLEYLANKDLAQQQQQQQQQQQMKQQQQQQIQQKKKMGEEEGNCSLYISGFTSESDEETITQLFAMYGPIQTCIFYKDKTTGRNKGDALIVYSPSILPQQRQQQQHLFKKDFLQHVCHQLNGAELPCHCILNVQPATPTKKTKKQQHDNTTTNNNNNTIVGMEKNDMVVEKQQQQQHSFKSDISATDLKEEDLDDFFASLE